MSLNLNPSVTCSSYEDSNYAHWYLREDHLVPVIRPSKRSIVSRSVLQLFVFISLNDSSAG
jgi:hypothetical protein